MNEAEHERHTASRLEGALRKIDELKAEFKQLKADLGSVIIWYVDGAPAFVLEREPTEDEVKEWRAQQDAGTNPTVLPTSGEELHLDAQPLTPGFGKVAIRDVYFTTGMDSDDGRPVDLDTDDDHRDS